MMGLKEVLVEEIALEGLDGICINALCIRLQDRKGFSFKIDDTSKPYIWNCVLGLKEIEFYQLEKPRADLVSYNRFHYIDPETRHFLDVESIPDDIYEYKVVDDENVLGSCADYHTRKNISEEVFAEKLPLQQALEKYGNTLVIVALQRVRFHHLLGPDHDPNVKIKQVIYIILEMIGRSRHNGIASYGKSSLLLLKESTKTMYYFLKCLRWLNVVKRQRLVLIEKPSNFKITCILYHLNRFYVEIGNRLRTEIVNMANYLSDKPECMEEVIRTKTDLKMMDIFKKVSQMSTRTGKRYFDFLDVPYREKFPNAKPKEYLLKNHNTERKIRHVRMIMPVNEILKSIKERDQEFDNDDDDDDDDDEDDDDYEDNPASKLRWFRQFDQPHLYQVMQVIYASGPKGVTLIQLKKIMKTHGLIVRRCIKILTTLNEVKSIMEDRGRQKTVMYIASEYFHDNKIHKVVNEKMKQLNTVPVTPSKDDTTNTKEASPKQSPALQLFKTEEPTEEKVSEIIEELDKTNEIGPGTVSEKALKIRREVMEQKQAESGVKVEVKEIPAEIFVEKRTGKEARGMKRFGAMLTESHVRRANWIIEVVSAIKVVVSYRMLKLLRNREKEMNLGCTMDHKSLKRLVNALCDEGKMKLFKAVISMGDKTKEFLYLCDITITEEDERLQRKLEEAKLLNFSVSKQELKDINLRKAAREQMTKKDRRKRNPNVPVTAMETIKSHQEYRLKLMAKMPPMKFDRNAGKKYGLLPKMMRIQGLHKYLMYLCYTTHGNKRKTDSNLGDPTEDKPMERIDALNVQKTDESTTAPADDEEDTDEEPFIYNDEMSWRRYLPPIPVHKGFPKGWCFVSDCLLIMPVCFFCQIVNVSYEIDGLMEILNHPKKKYYPLINLPFKLTQQLLHAKKYVTCFLHLCNYLTEMGLLSYGQEVLKEREQQFVYLHRYATLKDTRKSLPGYNKTTPPEGEPFPVKSFDFEEPDGLPEYWEFLQIVALNSYLGCKSKVQRDLNDEVKHTVREFEDVNRTFTPDTVRDDGVIPGDGRGGAGLDSSLFGHALKNWMNGSVSHASKHKYNLKKFDHTNLSVDPAREVVDHLNKNRIKGQDRLTLSENSDKPMTLKKVKRDNFKGNRGGKGILRPKTTTVTKTHKIVAQKEGRIMRKRSLKFPQASNIPPKKKRPNEKGDEKDKMIYRDRNKQRVGFTKKEDSVILMCWLANLIMDKRPSKMTLISYCDIRNYVHEKCGSVSYDKTSIAIHRRITFVLKNPQTETNILLYYREAMQDDFVLKNYVSKDFAMNDENLVPDFKILVDYLLEKFKSQDFTRCTLPENMDVLRKNYTLQYIGKLKKKKEFQDATCKADICRDVLRNILHSTVVLHDKQGRTHEMFKLLSQYPDVLLCQVIKELRTDGLLVINKKNYHHEAVTQLQTGMGLRNFKVSQRYLYGFKHRYLSAMFEECATMVTKLCDNYLHGNQTDGMYTLPYSATSGDCSAIFPLLLHNKIELKVTMPQELVIVDMEGFYNFPWGRGKGQSSNTKGDRLLQGMNKQPKDKSGNADKSYDSDDDSDIDIEPVRKANTKESENAETKTTEAEKPETALNESGNRSESEKSKESAKDIAEVDKKVVDGTEKNLGKAEVPTIEGDVKKAAESLEACDDKTGTSGAENANDEASNETTEQGDDDYTILTTRHSNIIIPKADPIPETNMESCMMSAIASRTLISLRRAEDCSFDDIRIFNAQDNFVVNSCAIELKIKDPTQDKMGNELIRVEKKSKDEVEIKNVAGETDASVNEGSQTAATGIETTDTKKDMVADPELLAEKKQHVSSLVLSKDKIKHILKDMQRLVPFSLDVEQVWKNIVSSGVSEDLLAMCKHMYTSIDSSGELGIRYYELKNVCQDNIFQDKECQYNETQLKEMWKHSLQILQDQSLVLKVGVTCTRYVSLNNARPWVIHAYRNLKGRGLHIDEDTDNVAPISKDESLSSLKSVNQTTSKSSLLVIESHDDIIELPTNDKAKSSNETQVTEANVDTINNSHKDNTVEPWASTSQSAEHSNTCGPDSENSNASKRKLNDETDPDKTSEHSVKTSEDSNENESKIKRAKRRKVEDTNEIKDSADNKRRDTNNAINSSKDVVVGKKSTEGDDIDNTNDDTESDKNIDGVSSKCETNETENKGKSESVAMATETPGMADTTETSRPLRKRKRLEPYTEPTTVNEPTAVSTYDKVRLVIQPWRKPEGGLNKDVLKMMLESVMLFLMMNPGSPSKELFNRYSPYIQPTVLMNLVDILEDIGCVTKQFMKKNKPSLFSKPLLPQIVTEEEEDCLVLLVPTDDCVLKMGLFGQVAFPNAKWPETCYPQISEKRLATVAANAALNS